MVIINNKYKFPFNEIIYFILFILFLVIITFSIFTVVGIGFLSFLGFEYDSIKSVFIFFVIYFCISKVTDIFYTNILDFIKYSNRLPYSLYKLIDFFIDCSLTFIIIDILDFFIKSVRIPTKTQILFAILSFAFSECIDFITKDNISGE
ncbi:MULTISPECIES: YrvL family regulatory protein [Clostridia]|uniref:YrvL family regulatory protein n=1 Tax=Clostridium sp. CCUG 7971 TaxID=2811414 RepID=UPI001ABA5C92|nr:hypothetical protein [Clostridium sp. CCUG 7971]